MLTHIESFFRRLRRTISRSEWGFRLLGLEKFEEKNPAPGLIIIQIDGFSRKQFHRALRKRKLPFIKSILLKENYKLHSFYSGIPSSTPAVQGEIFYGVKTAVPAFSFRDGESGEIFRMFGPQSAATVEKRLEKMGEGLLKGGASYGNIYTGGADEPRFCASSLGWGEIHSIRKPFVVAFLILTNIYSLIRGIFYTILEIFIAVLDAAFGLVKGESLFKELKFIPTRVGICILLREWITIGTKMDIARGLPIVHLNFLGYDEQSHRRGPSSAFAHWALKGIDDAVARIWRQAHNSHRRHYDVWIFSDHGQEKVTSYYETHGKTLEQNVSQIYANYYNRNIILEGDDKKSVQFNRLNLLGGKRIPKLFPEKINGGRGHNGKLTVAAMGPLAVVYLPDETNVSNKWELAGEMVTKAKAPSVLFTIENDEIGVCCGKGNFRLPKDKKEVFGANHPFLDEVCEDMLRAVFHRDSGDFLIAGWYDGIDHPVSFPPENGAHGGPGPQETHGFAMLPIDTVLPHPEKKYLRPGDLRMAAQHFMGKHEISFPQAQQKSSVSKKIRIMTYNVHSCIGMDRKHFPGRIARVLSQYKPDIIALQELDIGRQRTSGVDQAHAIADLLEMEFHFFGARQIEEGQYGNAVLSHFPMEKIKADPLPKPEDKPGLETRGALWVSIDIGGGKQLQFINTHLGLRSRERMLQTKALMGEQWLGNQKCKHPVILCGDFNSTPYAPPHHLICESMLDSQLVNGSRPAKTWFGRFPSSRLDYVFVSPELKVQKVIVPRNQLTLIASDHLPLIVEIENPVKS